MRKVILSLSQDPFSSSASSSYVWRHFTLYLPSLNKSIKSQRNFFDNLSFSLLFHKVHKIFFTKINFRKSDTRQLRRGKIHSSASRKLLFRVTEKSSRSDISSLFDMPIENYFTLLSRFAWIAKAFITFFLNEFLCSYCNTTCKCYLSKNRSQVTWTSCKYRRLPCYQLSMWIICYKVNTKSFVNVHVTILNWIIMQIIWYVIN